MDRILKKGLLLFDKVQPYLRNFRLTMTYPANSIPFCPPPARHTHTEQSYYFALILAGTKVNLKYHLPAKCLLPGRNKEAGLG